MFGGGGHGRLSARVAGREDHVQRHQRLQRMGSRLGEWSDMIADLAAVTDVDQFLCGLALLALMTLPVILATRAWHKARQKDPSI